MQMRLRILINGNWVDLTPEDAVTLHHDLGRALHVGLAPEAPLEAEAPRTPPEAHVPPGWPPPSVPHVVSLDPPTVATDPVGRFRPTAARRGRPRAGKQT